jgi:RimJ/RimL family protein N-acetyltransferase
MVSAAMNLHTAANRIIRHCHQHGAVATIRFLWSRVYRSHRYVVFDATLDAPRPRTKWQDGEELIIFGPENVDSAMTPELQSFLGGSDAIENLNGVRAGDRLFVVTSDVGYLHCGYILFKSRQTKILGESESVPLIGCCLTARATRGRGLYRRALNAELCYLREQGYKRALIETNPGNVSSRNGIEAAGFQFRREISVRIVLNWLVWQKAVDPSGVKRRLIIL